MLRTGITDMPIDPARVLASLSTEADGAALLFLGVVRNHNEGRPVTGVAYEAYAGMAEETLNAIAEEARERFGTDRVTVIHRVGELVVGDVATAIGVASPHRGEAYGASRYIIEEIKKRLPVWKKEAYVGGGEGWVEGHVPTAGEQAGGTDGGEGGDQ